MNKKIIGIAVAIVLVLLLSFVVFKQIFPGEYVPTDDEIAIHIQMDTKEDVGLLVFDYRADDYESSGGICNADKSLIKQGSDVVEVWNKRELGTDSDAVALSIRIRIITEYVTPNYENIYPEEITKYANSISWEAHFGKSYSVTITGDKTNGYKAVFNH